MELTASHITESTASCEETTNKAVVLLVRRAIGERTLSQFCKESGLSIGYISRLLNGRLESNPTVRTLAKISYAGWNMNTRDTFEDLLEKCGYSLSQEEIQKEIRIVERAMDVVEEERKKSHKRSYGTLELGASAIGLMFAKLIAMGANLQLKSSPRPNDGVEFEIKGFGYSNVVAIPGFCGNSHQTILAERDILSILLRYVQVQTESTLYLVLTDNKEVFDYVSDELLTAKNVTGCVLRANGEHSKFVEQRFCGAEEIEKESSIDFVRDTK